MIRRTVLAALTVRRIANAAGEAAWYLSLALRYRRPLPGIPEVVRFLLRCLPLLPSGIAIKAEGRPARDLPVRDLPARDLPVRRESVAVRNPPVRPPALLTDARACRLQGTILHRLLQLECGLSLSQEERLILGKFSSSAWVRYNILTAAGCGTGRALPARELEERCRVVLPVVLNSLRMHLAHLANTPVTTNRRVRVLQRRYRIGEHGEIRGCLYPRRITREKRRFKVEALREATAQRYRSARTTREAEGLERYLAAVSLVVTADLTRPRRAARVLDALRRVVERQNDNRRIPWRPGTGRNARSTGGRMHSRSTLPRTSPTPEIFPGNCGTSIPTRP